MTPDANVQNLEYIAAEVRRVALTRFRKDSCIATTKMLVQLFRQLGAPARPLPTMAYIANAPLLARIRAEGDIPKAIDQAAGEWSIGLGTEEPLHIVAIVGEAYLVDASLDQASRPAQGVELGPLVTRVPEGFGRETGDVAEAIQAGCLVAYRSHPETKVYRSSPNWADRRQTADLVNTVVKSLAMKGDLSWG